MLERRPQEYRLTVETASVTIVAGELAGLQAGFLTLLQLVDLCVLFLEFFMRKVLSLFFLYVRTHYRYGKAPLPRLRIVDWPDLVHRGYMLDVSRDKVHFASDFCCRSLTI
jgi:N-acetyl-beta-hexosaminidase